MSPDRSALGLCVDVLGPLVLRVRGQDVVVPGQRRRALLAVLALAGGKVVSTERLIDALWPDEPPTNAGAALHNHVSRLRGHLGPESERLERHASGYRLVVRGDEVDEGLARRLAGLCSASGTPPATRAASARAALALWRGEAIEEFRGWPALEPTAVGLDELRLRLVDDLLDARLALGEPDVAVAATSAAAAAPLRERTVLLLVRALAQDGRAAEAMARAQEFRHLLGEETGLDPGPTLAELEQQVAAGVLARDTDATFSAGPRAVGRPDGPLVGRQREREEVRRLLADNAMVVLTGPGGVGKTRLALEVAADVSIDGSSGDAGVSVVDLAAVDSVDRACQAVASTLGLRTPRNLSADDVARALTHQHMLLVLDNCEHVSEACRSLITTVRRCAPGVRVLATSRSVLHVPGEHVVRLQPLPVPREPTSIDALRRQPAVRAFLEHARRRRPGFDLAPEDTDHLIDVLRRLDGLPLGIELAARQVAVMPLSEVRHRLDRALDLAIGPATGDDERQGTLRATIRASYQLLPDHEQWLLRALAPFPGGVDLASVEAIAAGGPGCGDPLDVLHRLVDASLVVADAAAGRYRLLFTVRRFLLDELADRRETAEAEARFLERCLVVAAEVGLDVLGPDEARADRRLRAELDNLRAARDLARTIARDDVRVGLTIHLSEAATWRDIRELWAWALELAGDPSLAGHPQRAAILGCAAEGARLLGDLDGATALANESLAVAGHDPDDELVHRAWVALGSVAHFRGDFETARDAWLRSGAGRPTSTGAWLASAALAAGYGGHPDEARGLLDRAHIVIAASGCGSHAAFASYVEGELRAREHVEEAVQYYEEAIEQARACGVAFVAGVASVALASARTRMGDHQGAAQLFHELLETWRRTGHTTQLWTTARNAAALLAAVGKTRAAGLVLVCAEMQPGAATVNERIARHSGRVFVPLAQIVPADEEAELRAEVSHLGQERVLDLAGEELASFDAIDESGQTTTARPR